MDYQLFLESKVFEKRAYLPKKSSSGKWIWLKTYYKIAIYFYNDDLTPAEETVWHKILTKNEYLLWRINNPPKKGNLFN